MFLPCFKKCLFLGRPNPKRHSLKWRPELWLKNKIYKNWGLFAYMYVWYILTPNNFKVCARRKKSRKRLKVYHIFRLILGKSQYKNYVCVIRFWPTQKYCIEIKNENTSYIIFGFSYSNPEIVNNSTSSLFCLNIHILCTGLIGSF